ncbi:conserved membrane protein of unknown function [Magnetospirillum gryphiswaldense MSR-1 v2]|uniref:DUF3429 domain-containing protein n=1 Tax=Magnetospirillum gryphiswaldense (strain DSM 6361 / JCM 21280 / NBRC 15271 / MSR-1) TaxID=431944 RepID=V6F372_MAGGM|nr:DUF3429 domain-containing protein [Magnetospirillum gryphiswaldense]CDK99985.1 conserved membrane protein of unknown function [Magnetospirillum gryphiswaldense MSR-1 v2]
MHVLSLRHGDGTARALSYLGLIPFIAGILVAWAPFPELRAQALTAVAIYGAVILSFIGAVHWGRVITAPAEDPLGSLWLIWAVAPSLLGWFATLLPSTGTMPVLIIGFVLAWFGDRRAVQAGLLPLWYGHMRDRLTVVVCTTLTASLPLVF